MLCKLFGMACIVEMIREKLGMLLYTFQHNLKAQAKKMARMFLLVALAFILLGLGLRFLLLGLACWLNVVFSSTYIGFFLVSIFCFLMVVCMVLVLRTKINHQAVEQNEIMDGQ